MKSIIPFILIAASTAAIAQEQETKAVEPTACHSGDWFSVESEGEGYNMNVLPNGSATFYFYSYNDDGSPTFFTGVLNQLDNNCLQGQMFFSFGGRMFSDQNPQSVQRLPLFQTTICLASDDAGLVSFNLLDDPDTPDDETQTFVLRDFIRLTPKHEGLCND